MSGLRRNFHSLYVHWEALPLSRPDSELPLRCINGQLLRASTLILAVRRTLVNSVRNQSVAICFRDDSVDFDDFDTSTIDVACSSCKAPCHVFLPYDKPPIEDETILSIRQSGSPLTVRHARLAI